MFLGRTKTETDLGHDSQRTTAARFTVARWQNHGLLKADVLKNYHI